MSARNTAKGREAENAVAEVFRANGMPHAERRAKRGGFTELPCLVCEGNGCLHCDGTGTTRVHRDAGDLAGIPGVAVQVKWSGYASLAKDMAATELQRQAAGADIGLLVRKRKGVGLGRAGEWDAYLPLAGLLRLVRAFGNGDLVHGESTLLGSVWRTDLTNAAQLIALAGYGVPEVTA